MSFVGFSGNLPESNGYRWTHLLLSETFCLTNTVSSGCWVKAAWGLSLRYATSTSGSFMR